MIRQPLVRRSGFPYDIANFLTLRRLYREPAQPAICDRCRQPAVGTIVVNGPNKYGHSKDRLCLACLDDLAWFMMTPPEQPNSSSDSVSGETEVPNG